MNKELIINVTSSDINIALLEDKKLIELNTEKSNIQYSVGDIYLGKIKKLMPGLNAAFVNIGYERDAFLHYHDLGPQFKSLQNYLTAAIKHKGMLPSMQKFKRYGDINKNGKITKVLSAGQLVVTQITKEPISTKGPRLTSEISIAGRNLVVMPFNDKVSVSQKISSIEERNRLKTLLQSIKPNNYGVIIRTVAEGKKVKDLDNELRNLVQKWEQSFNNLKGLKPPHVLISELKRTSAILRDMLNVTFNSIYVDDERIYREITGYISTIAPEKAKIIKLYKSNTPIFEQLGVEKQIKSSFGKTVSFKNGAYIIIEHTEALHVIDVNSGNRAKTAADQETNALEVNVAAAKEIARQLRLRDMGGIIVIDFIDMQSSKNKQIVNEKMKESMSADRAKHTILPLSKFGLMQITRQRVRPEMNISTTEICPTCNGTGEISPSILFVDNIKNRISFILQEKRYKKLIVKVHPYIAAFINKGIWPVRLRWRFQFKCKFRIIPVSSFNFLEYNIFDEFGEEILH